MRVGIIGSRTYQNKRKIRDMIFLGLITIVAYFLLPVFIVDRVLEKYMTTRWMADNIGMALLLVVVVELCFFIQIIYWINKN